MTELVLYGYCWLTSPKAKAKAVSEAPFLKKDFRVLVVDDEEIILNLIQRQLSKAEYICQISSVSTEALKLLEEESFDLVLSDIKMPNLSGVELVEALLEKSPETMVVFITGYAEYATLVKAVRLQPIGFLEKPFSQTDLIRIVDKAYQQKCQSIEGHLRSQELQQLVSDKTSELEFKDERLLAEKEMISGIISNANFGLIAVDNKYYVHLINPYTFELLNINAQFRDLYLGMSLDEMLDENLRPAFVKLFKDVMDQGKLLELNLTHPVNEKSLNMIGYPLRFKDEIIAVVIVIHDVTEKEILYKRFLQSAKLASIGELAAGVAHEINNPLGFVTSNINTLTGYIDKLKEYIEALESSASNHNGGGFEAHRSELRTRHDVDYITGDVQSLLQETCDGLSRVSKIVKDLKTFARPDEGVPQVCLVNTLIDDALNLVRNEIKYSLDVVREYEEMPEIMGYPNQLVQVFTNLFINSAHAVKEKGVLKISTHVSKGSIVIKIADNGCGIHEKNLPKIFDPFFTTKPPGKGTGMGLSISYGIIQKHGGSMAAESKIGEGTEFTLRLPLKGIAATGEKPAQEKMAKV